MPAPKVPSPLAIAHGRDWGTKMLSGIARALRRDLGAVLTGCVGQGTIQNYEVVIYRSRQGLIKSIRTNESMLNRVNEANEVRTRTIQAVRQAGVDCRVDGLAGAVGNGGRIGPKK
ncbi:hypothetical protein C8R45DRAFT_945912 [Mycena sanguinolenta]|nr:hypothetical protein C8R45DRAFT_945912 [Mycena sanguinolenta]